MIPPSKEEIEAVQASRLFDAKWYLETYSEVRVLGMEPAEHYLWYGARLDCDPSPEFKANNYLKDNPDVEANGLNPLLHFLATRECETKPEGSVIPRTKRQTRLLIHPNPAPNGPASKLDNPATDGVSDAAIAANAEPGNAEQLAQWRKALLPYADAQFYLRRYQDVAVKEVDPLTHFIEYGFSEGRDLNPFTHTRFMKNVYGANGWSLDVYADLISRDAHINAFLTKPINVLDLRDRIDDGDWQACGLFVFDVRQYAAKQFDLFANPSINALEHMFTHGLHQNRLRASGLLDADVVYGAESTSDYELAQLQTEPFRHISFGTLRCPDPPRFALIGVNLGIGVVLYNNSRVEVERLMRSIVHNSHSFGGLVHVSIWDNSPTSLDLEYVPEILIGLSLKIHRCPANNGFSGGHNALMSECFGHSCTHYLGLNPDGWLLDNAMYEALCFSLSLRDNALIELKTEPVCHPKWYHPETGQTDWVSGAAFVLPRVIFESMGGFDPDFPLYCEDVDFSFRARQAGFGLYVATSALFYHDITGRFAEDTPQRKKLMLIGTWYLCAKWGQDARAQKIFMELLRMGINPTTLPTVKEPAIPSDDIGRLFEQERFAHSRYWR